jgi:hypothetical protein
VNECRFDHAGLGAVNAIVYPSEMNNLAINENLLPRRKLPAQSSILVIGLARDCARRLAASIATLDAAVTGFARVQFLVIESDSSDSTVDILKGIKLADPRLNFHSLGSLRLVHPKRTERIAVCRNHYLEQLRTNAAYADVDYVLVADLDGVIKDLTADALRSCWRVAEDWAVCTGNQGDYYYDIWALRHPIWCSGDVHEQQKSLEPLFGRAASLDVAFLSKMVHIPPTTPLIEVDSAFSGLAVYKKEVIVKASYVGLKADGSEICEHVTFHAALKAQGAKIYINPAMITARTTRHAGQRKFFRTLRRKLFEKLRAK